MPGGALGLNLNARAEREHVDAGDVHDFSGNRPCSVEAWIKPRDLGAQTLRIISKEHGGAGYLLGADAGGGLLALRAGQRPDRPGAYDGEAMRLWFDGRQAGAARPPWTACPTTRARWSWVAVTTAPVTLRRHG